MIKLIPLLFLLGCAGVTEPSISTPDAPAVPDVATPLPTETPVQAPDGGPTCDAATARACATDADCACGTDKASGACAFGNAACIDTEKQCPDFCTGITGTMRLACVNNTCTQSMGTPPQAN